MKALALTICLCIGGCAALPFHFNSDERRIYYVTLYHHDW